MCPTGFCPSRFRLTFSRQKIHYMKYFENELTRALRSRFFGVSLLISLLLLFIGLASFYPLDPTPPPGLHFAFYNAYDAWKTALRSGAFVLFAPLAAALPYADTYAQERSQKFSRYVLTRTKHKKYLAIKVIVNVLVGGLVVALPMAIFFAFTFFRYPQVLPPLSGTVYSEDWMRTPGFLSEIFVPFPNRYIFIRITLGFLFGCVYSLLGMSISAFTNNRYIILTFPFISFLILGFFMNFLGIPKYWTAYVLQTDGISTSTPITIFLPLLSIFTLSLFILFLKVKKYGDFLY